MTDFEKIAKLMRADWNRRINHDYRFWMSDGYKDDEQMWRSGERDLDILCKGIENVDQKSVLEVGCGVGRLLMAASKRFASVTGVDVSSDALAKAREFLKGQKNVSIIQGNGYDLSDLADESFDFVFSFAALTSIPTDIIANYLREFRRVVKSDGTFRLQCYLGTAHHVSADDTLHLRCYCRTDFEAAMSAAGFAIESVEELVLPFQVSFKELGIEAVVVSLKPENRAPASAKEISALLLPGGEREETGAENRENDLEYWMTVNYAKELVEKGDLEHARETLEYATVHSSNTTIDVRDLLDRIVGEIEKKTDSGESEKNSTSDVLCSQSGRTLGIENADIFERNFKALSDQFPEAARTLRRWIDAGERDYRVVSSDSSDGKVIQFDGQCLDHPTRPVAAAKKWAESTLREATLSERGQASIERICIYGVASGYHIESLIQITDRKLSAVEPLLPVFFEAMCNRDFVSILTHLENLEIGEEATPTFMDEKTYLALRPLSQMATPEHCTSIKQTFYGERGLKALQPRIGVLGPMMGGTLPIMNYTSRALGALQQRNVQYDMSEFAGGFHQLDSFVRDDVRKSLLRGNYTEMLSNLLLESIDERPIDILICMAQCPITGGVLTELRKRGIVTVLWFVEDYLRFHYWQPMSQYFDFIFTIQRGRCMELMKAAGAGHVHYLPTGCDPLIHAPVMLSEEDKEYWGSPVSFFGAGYHNRQQMFASLVNLPFKIWGTEWPQCYPFDSLVQGGGKRLQPEEYIKIFSATDININLHSSTERDGVDPYGDFLNPRTFELASSGAFQLVDHREYLAEAFEEGSEVAVFRDRKELTEKIEYYLAHPEERAKMTEAARKRAVTEHTYTHRIREMLSVVYSHKFEHLKRRQDQSPWSRLRMRAEKHPELLERCEVSFARGEDANLDGLVADIVTGEGNLSETELKLLFLFHLKKQIVRMKQEEATGRG